MSNHMESIKARLVKIRNTLGKSQREISEFLGISFRGWQTLEYGKANPSAETLIKLREKGFSTDWILSGQGDMRLDVNGNQEGSQTPESAFETPSNPLKSAPDKDFNAVPDELYARVFEAVTKTYDELKIRISPRVLGELISAKSKELAAVSNDSDEWPGMVKLMAAQIRQELLKPVSDPERSKHTA